MQLASLSHGVPVSLCFTSKNIPLEALNSHIISQNEQFYVCRMNIFVLELNFLMQNYKFACALILILKVAEVMIDQTVQDVPGGKGNILGGHNIGNSKQESIHVHVSYSEGFLRQSCFTAQYTVQTSRVPCLHTSCKVN